METFHLLAKNNIYYFFPKFFAKLKFLSNVQEPVNISSININFALGVILGSESGREINMPNIE